MYKFIIFAALVAFAHGYGYGSRAASAGATKSASGYRAGPGFATAGGYRGLSGFSQPTTSYVQAAPAGPIQVAVTSNHQIRYIDVPATTRIQPITIEVGSQAIPVSFIFRSSSSQLSVQQEHEQAQGSVQESQSEDEPHVLRHSVTKPIIQEVHEVITPVRKITQEIQPVQEEVQTIVARNSGSATAAATPVVATPVAAAPVAVTPVAVAPVAIAPAPAVVAPAPAVIAPAPAVLVPAPAPAVADNAALLSASRNRGAAAGGVKGYKA